ncbi:MAG: potassium-transporting ATPase subunit C, partial [Desulfobaccales bacterium]
MNAQELLQEVKMSVLVTVVLVILLCGVYPLVVWGIAQIAFPSQANGSLVARQGQVVGSALIAQNFTSPQYFHPRPSAAGDVSYDGTSSGGSNLGP